VAVVIDSRTAGAADVGRARPRTPQTDTPEPEAPKADRHPRPARAARRIPGLDGLRALAVVAVIAYHLFPGALPGGFLGVDVFFVVSGFLITTLLLREVRDGGRLQLGRFWVRRARRLLPALVTVIAVAIPAAAIVDRDLLVGIGRQVLGALTFSTNWLAVAAGTSYFDATQPELFQTFWSLAIEEQFYLVWPLLLAVLLAACHTWRGRTGVAFGAAVASAAAMTLLYHPGDDPTRVYYGTLTHAFGLLLGASAAFAWAGRAELLPRRSWARWLGPAALVLLGAMAAFVSAAGSFAYRGGIFGASLLALVAVVSCTGARTGYVRVLDMRPLTWVGERSYGLYLWHWPVILVLAAAAGDGPGSVTWWRTATAAVAVTVLLSWASYRWVETPVRQLGAREVARRAALALHGSARGPRVVAGAAALVVIAATVCVFAAPSQSQAQQSVQASQREIDARNAREAARPDPTDAPTHATAGAVSGDQVVAFGDSVLSAAAPTLYDELPGIRIDAKPIRKWIDAAPIVEKAAADGMLRPVVVLSFGTNGGFQFEGSAAAFDDVIAAIGPDRRVVVLTINGISHWVPDANRQLEALAARHPNVTVVDWGRYATSHTGMLHTDRTHPTMAGVEAYADLLRSAWDDLQG
jgi:peptidoglycan/LPS O-acetylase OafA/YrhL